MATQSLVAGMDLYPMYDDLSDGIIVITGEGKELYRNKAMQFFPEHLEDRLLEFCGSESCGCTLNTTRHLIARAKMEGWRFKCHKIGQNKVVIVKFDNILGERIKMLREDFAHAIREGTPAPAAAMQVLRNNVSSRWVSIGKIDFAKEQIDFDLAFDGDRLDARTLPPIFKNKSFDLCHNMAITSDLGSCFANPEVLGEVGIGHVIGMSLKNHHNECIGYALLADEQEPQDVSDTVTLLQELAALYGPYFEVGSIHEQVQQAVADANTDIVTGHGNRRAMEAYLQSCLQTMKGEQDESEILSLFNMKAMRNSVVMLVDLDGFKRVNDIFGHSEGDRALKLVADSLHDFEVENFVFRYGGDELVQVYPRAGDLDADHLRLHVNSVERKLSKNGFKGLGLSIGVVHLFEGDGTIASLMTLADARMYHEKRTRAVTFV
ncbi:GGDEF domain-containing protein [uncultured Cohaesibacter sp.]|uniref:GGDEF domain-containing protein n=1 Tax=uncultured Cohaesibacter sp. TaxID=1002546 RepID=UPI00292E1498|nr:GGDEF domain-containing protein [uncultured Cohaesibacter sp.]